MLGSFVGSCRIVQDRRIVWDPIDPTDPTIWLFYLFYFIFIFLFLSGIHSGKSSKIIPGPPKGPNPTSPKSQILPLSQNKISKKPILLKLSFQKQNLNILEKLSSRTQQLCPALPRLHSPLSKTQHLSALLMVSHRCFQAFLSIQKHSAPAPQSRTSSILCQKPSTSQPSQ